MADEILTGVEVAQFRKVTEKAVYTMAHKRLFLRNPTPQGAVLTACVPQRSA